MLLKVYAELWNWVSLNPQKEVHFTLADDSVVVGLMPWVRVILQGCSPG